MVQVVDSQMVDGASFTSRRSCPPVMEQNSHWHCPLVEDGLNNTQNHLHALVAAAKDRARQINLVEPSDLQDSTLVCDLGQKVQELFESALGEIEASTKKQLQEMEILLSKTNSELQTKIDECAGLQHQLNTLQKETVQVDVERQQSVERLHKLHEMNVKAAEDRVAADHEEKISDLERVVKKLTSDINVLETEHTSREAASRTQAEESIAKIQQQLQAANLELDASKARILELEAKDQLSHQKLEAKDEELRAKHHECDKKSEELLKKIEELSEFQKETSQRFAALRSSHEETLQNYQAESRHLQESLQERTTTRVTTVTTEVGSNELQDRIANLREENTSKSEENLQLRHDYARLQSECGLLKDKLVPFLQQIASNEEALQEANSRLLEAEQHKHNHQVDLLTMLSGVHQAIHGGFASAPRSASFVRRSSFASLATSTQEAVAKATQDADPEISGISTASEGAPDEEVPQQSDSDEC